MRRDRTVLHTPRRVASQWRWRSAQLQCEQRTAQHAFRALGVRVYDVDELEHLPYRVGERVRSLA